MSATGSKMASGGLGMVQAFKHERAPQWNGQKHTYTAWAHEMAVYLKLCGLWHTMCGVDRAEKDSTATGVAAEYEMRSMLTFRILYRAILETKDEGAALKMMIRDEFGDDSDGFELGQYLKAYAEEVTSLDVKHMRAKLDSITFKLSDGPAKWAVNTQTMREIWARIPENRRGGDDEVLSELLLDKVQKVESGYVDFIRAFLGAPGTTGALSDYQGIAKMICDRHKEKRGYKQHDSLLAAESTTGRKTTTAQVADAFAGQNWQSNRPKRAGRVLAPDECGRCGEKGHFKRDCTKVCEACGLKSCGGVRSKDRCMTIKGVPPDLRKKMAKDEKGRMILKLIDSRATAMGIKGRGEANTAEVQSYEYEPEAMLADGFVSAADVEDFFDAAAREGAPGVMAAAHMMQATPYNSQLDEDDIDEAIFANVSSLISWPLSSKVTGMLVERSLEFRKSLLDDPSLLYSGVIEALDHLDQALTDEDSDEEERQASMQPVEFAPGHAMREKCNVRAMPLGELARVEAARLRHWQEVRAEMREKIRGWVIEADATWDEENGWWDDDVDAEGWRDDMTLMDELSRQETAGLMREAAETEADAADGFAWEEADVVYSEAPPGTSKAAIERDEMEEAPHIVYHKPHNFRYTAISCAQAVYVCFWPFHCGARSCLKAWTMPKPPLAILEPVADMSVGSRLTSTNALSLPDKM